MHFRTVLRNIFSTWAGYAVTLLVGFLLAPFVVHHLGTSNYGTWTLLSSLTGYFGLLDLGLRASVGRFVARHMALSDEAEVNQTISNALALLGAAGVIAFLAAIILSSHTEIFHIEGPFQSDARLALLIAGAAIAIALPMSVFNAVLFSLERFDVITGITILGALTRTTLILSALSRGHGMVALAVVTRCCPAASNNILAALCAKKMYPPLRPRLAFIERAGCKQLLTFGSYRFIWIVANQLIFYTDSVVIGIFLNTAAITYYAIAGSLINYGRNIISVTADTFAPMASHLDAHSDAAGLRNLLVDGTRITLTIGLPLCMGFLFLGKQFIVLWMGPAYAVSSIYLIVLAIPQFTSMPQYISAMILVGMARHRKLAFVVMAEGIANVLLSIILIRRVGLIGVAWGTAIPHLLSTGVVIPIRTLRALDMRWRDYFLKALLRPLVAAVPGAALCFTFSRLVVRPTWAAFGFEVAAIACVSGIASYYLCLSAERRARIWQGAQIKPVREWVRVDRGTY